MQDLAGKTAVVTGGASGIGRAMGRRFGAEGMKVVLADIEPGPLREAVRDLEAQGVEAIGVATDVSQADQVCDLRDRALDAFGAVHVVCNNAGVFAGGLSWEAPTSDYEWILGVNVWGVIHGIRSFVPLLLEQDEGHVVNTASMAAVTSMPLAGAYAMSKHAVLALSESLYHELSGRGSNVGVSALCPEVIDTRISVSARNRPPHLKRTDEEAASPETNAVETALRDTLAQGEPPEKMADRVVVGIREKRFYLLAEPDNGWRLACNQRLDDVRNAANPTFLVPQN